jgi:imidazole glycerol-phosphate synthase subunit HisF
MKFIRVIPKLDIKGPNLVKGIHLEGLRVLGKPEDFARYYYENGADELIYIDMVASLYGRNSLEDIISKTAKEIFIPLTVGGGLRTIKDIKKVLRAGADKVALNTAVIKNPQLIKDSANMFGSSTITVSIEAIRGQDGRFLAYTDNGREYTGVEVIKWAKLAENLGAGEILLTSIDQEGTGSGYDIELTRLVTDKVSIPVVACGGAGSLADIKNVIVEGKSDAVAIASFLHYGITDHFPDKNYMLEGNTEFLKRVNSNTKKQTTSINDIKTFLLKKGINCRYYRKK